mmetsp:Transcript_36720/g.97218  ORF Transcript_36720/g.97218 Transcript_36720/m.97218 type:complete len:262 (+) Transcript_36720:591-1376(+)
MARDPQVPEGLRVPRDKRSDPLRPEASSQLHRKRRNVDSMPWGRHLGRPVSVWPQLARPPALRSPPLRRPLPSSNLSLHPPRAKAARPARTQPRPRGRLRGSGTPRRRPSAASPLGGGGSARGPQSPPGRPRSASVGLAQARLGLAHLFLVEVRLLGLGHLVDDREEEEEDERDDEAVPQVAHREEGAGARVERRERELAVRLGLRGRELRGDEGAVAIGVEVGKDTRHLLDHLALVGRRVAADAVILDGAVARLEGGLAH